MPKLQMTNSTVEIIISLNKTHFKNLKKKARFVKKCKNVGGARFLAFSIYEFEINMFKPTCVFMKN